MNLRPGIILQARLASTRLPGKAMSLIGGRTMLDHCLQRLIGTGIHRIVLATTDRADDDVLAEAGARAGVAVFRGDADDVLGRFAAAAERFHLDPIVRATADNPAVDVGAARRLLERLARTGADYVHEVGLPVGAGMEALTAPALHYAAAVATSPYDREHVTTFIKSHPGVFRVDACAAPARLVEPSLRMTVDTADDLQWVRELFALVGHPEASLPELIAAGRARRQEVA